MGQFRDAMDNVRLQLVASAANVADNTAGEDRSWSQTFLHYLASEGFVITEVMADPHKHRLDEGLRLTSLPVVPHGS